MLAGDTLRAFPGLAAGVDTPGVRYAPGSPGTFVASAVSGTAVSGTVVSGTVGNGVVDVDVPPPVTAASPSEHAGFLLVGCGPYRLTYPPVEP